MTNTTDSPAGIADGEKRIAEILERHENATKGPWKQRINYAGDPSAGWVVTSHGAKSGQQRTICFMSDGYGSGNHQFIANSWDDVSYLLAERENLIARLKRAEAERDRYRKATIHGDIEQLTKEEVREALIASGIDPDESWKRAKGVIDGLFKKIREANNG